MRLTFGQKAPPPEGFSVARFEASITAMEARLEQMLREKDHRAVFQLTYLTFSKQVEIALKAGRFADAAWATDMCCRFVDVYLEQLALWDARDPSLCRAWRVAFEAMEEKRLNVLQAMLLGMNAHINYDLAFVTLGACRHAGDVVPDDTASHALTRSLGGVPTVRYRDFLLINQVGWESIPKIQDTVLRAFSAPLYWGNRLTLRATRFFGERILIEARETSWCQTALLLHSQDEQEALRVARVIDAYAASIADLIGTLSYRPDQILESIASWLRRYERLDPELQAGLVAMAERNPVVAELALRELAFAGAEPVSIIETLLARGEKRLAAVFVELCLAHAPLRRRQRLLRYLEDSRGRRAVDVLVREDAVPASMKRAPSIEEARARQRTEGAMRSAARRLPEVQRHQILLRALTSAEPAGVFSDEELRTFLLANEDLWIRTCAAQAFDAMDGREVEMMSLIERVLFLKETPVFMEVDPAVLVHVAEKLEVRKYSAGATLVREGDRTGGIYFVTAGEVRVSQKRAGKTAEIAKLHPRDTVGELSALNDTPATADCTAVTATECHFLSQSVLSHLLHEHPRLSIGLIRMLSQRLMATTLRVQAA